MSNAYSLLLDTAALLKLDSNRVTIGEKAATLMLQGVEITVSSTEGAKNRSPMARVKFSCDSITGDIRVRPNSGYSYTDKSFKRDDPKRFEKVASIVFGFDSESEE